MKYNYEIMVGSVRKADASLQPRGGNVWEISDIEAYDRQKGYGRRMLTEVCRDADAEGVKLVLTVCGYGPLRGEELTQWYARFGFVVVDGAARMERKPGATIYPSCGDRAPVILPGPDPFDHAAVAAHLKSQPDPVAPEPRAGPAPLEVPSSFEPTIRVPLIRHFECVTGGRSVPIDALDICERLLLELPEVHRQAVLAYLVSLFDYRART